LTASLAQLAGYRCVFSRIARRPGLRSPFSQRRLIEGSCEAGAAREGGSDFTVGRAKDLLCCAGTDSNLLLLPDEAIDKIEFDFASPTRKLNETMSRFGLQSGCIPQSANHLHSRMTSAEQCEQPRSFIVVCSVQTHQNQVFEVQ
jgi:hypothetical protein